MDTDIVALSNLLNKHSGSKKNENNDIKDRTQLLTPASFYPKLSSNQFSLDTLEKRKDDDDDTIWETTDTKNIHSSNKHPRDPRPQPLYEVYYKQNVGAEDVFMRGALLTGSTSCSHIVIKVHFPGVKSASELELDVKPETVTVSSRER